MSDVITPVVLTLDEAPNLGRLLPLLGWAREVLVVDSGSTDGTQEIARAAANVRVVHHPFEGFAAQWQFAMDEAGVNSEWILALDADHLPDDAMLESLRNFSAPPDAHAYKGAFVYCIQGQPLRGSLYPPREVLFRRGHVRFEQVGHKQVMQVEGEVGMLPGRILHDDRKDFSRWLDSQWCYALQEAALIDGCSFGELSMSACVRKLLLPAPPAAFFMAWLVRGGVLDGWTGLHYATERLVAEALISLALIRRRLLLHGRSRGC